MDECLNEWGMVPTRVEPAACDARHIPIAEEKHVGLKRNARSCNCDRWGHPYSGCGHSNVELKGERPFSLPLNE